MGPQLYRREMNIFCFYNILELITDVAHGGGGAVVA